MLECEHWIFNGLCQSWWSASIWQSLPLLGYFTTDYVTVYLWASTRLEEIILHGAESFLRSWPVFRQSKKSPHCVEPEGSLPHSQVSTTCPYPEPSLIQSIPQNPTSWRSILILPSHLCLGPKAGLSYWAGCRWWTVNGHQIWWLAVNRGKPK